MKRVIIGKWARFAGAAAMLWLANGCATFEESGLPGSASSMARNQIMLVRAEPESFGHYRLASLIRIYPDLDLFVAKRGVPDFLAEASNSGQHYYILFYLKDRQSYSARTRAPHPKRLEFSGPYPVTDKERKTLDQMQQKQSTDLHLPRESSSGTRSF
jgi:hypothetical protein